MTCIKPESPSGWDVISLKHGTEGKLGETGSEWPVFCRLNRKKHLKGSIEVMGRESSKTHSHIHTRTQSKEWLNHIAWKTRPATGSSDCRCPVPSVIKPEASTGNHSILTLRHQSALQQYRPIINPQDVPTLKSSPFLPVQKRIRVKPPSAA